MTVSRSKMLVLVVAFALVFFVGLPKRLFAHPAAAKATLAFAQQGSQDDNKQQEDANKKDENQDLNDDRQDGPNDELNNEMDGAHHDGSLDEDRVEDQQQDQHEDADGTPPSL
jgi:Sec-independent protein translocase protein TatA